jgi:hypothetical protein
MSYFGNLSKKNTPKRWNTILVTQQWSGHFQDVERGVKLGNLAKKTGRQEMKVSTNGTATNAFREFSRQEYDSNDEDDKDNVNRMLRNRF